MIIAVLSDIHDNIWNLADALGQIVALKAEALVFCGDFCAPFTLSQMAEGFSGPIHCVLGNNDGDPRLLHKNALSAGNVTLQGHQGAELELGGAKIAVNHYPEVARPLAATDRWDLVCFGHNHEASLEQVGNTVLANPGEVMGRFGKPSFGLYDTVAKKFVHRQIRHYPETGGALAL